MITQFWELTRPTGGINPHSWKKRKKKDPENQEQFYKKRGTQTWHCGYKQDSSTYLPLHCQEELIQSHGVLNEEDVG